MSDRTPSLPGVSPARLLSRLGMAWRPGVLARAFCLGLLLAGMGALGGCAADYRHGALGTVDGSGRTVSGDDGLDPDNAPSPSASYLAGRFALEQGDLRAAADNFMQALSVYPDNLELRRQVFLLHLASGDFGAAITDARILRDVDPSSEEVRLLLALEQAHNGDLKAARRDLLALPTVGIAAVVVPVLNAWAQFGAGDQEGAMRALTVTGKDDPLAPLRRYHRAVMLALVGRDGEARELMAPLLEGDDPAPARILITVAAIDMRSGRSADAEALLAPRVEPEEGSVVLGDALAAVRAGKVPAMPVHDAASGMADALLGIGEALSRQRAGASGLLLARLASYLAPDQSDVWLLIGRIAADQGNAEAAIEALAQIPPQAPQSWEARLASAEALQDSGRIDDAVALLGRMADERSERTDALVSLGDLLRRNERFADAEAAYSRAIGRLTRTRAEDWRLFYARGIAYERTDRWPLAEADLLKALELEPEQPYVLNYLGYSWVDKGLNLERAKGMLNRAVELRPQDGFIVDSLGWAYYRVGQYEDAVTQLERAVELEPGDPVLNDHLGDAYWRVGRQREARFQWQRALSLKPAADQIAQIEDKLERGLPTDSAHRG